jgi:nitrogen fixation-related uncharacterized protein
MGVKSRERSGYDDEEGTAKRVLKDGYEEA